MAAFFLFVDKSDPAETASILNNSLGDYGGAYSWVYTGHRIGIARESFGASGPNAIDQDPLNRASYFVHNESGCIIVSDSRIDYRQELAGKLGISWTVAESFPDCKLILLAYLKWGEACLSHLYGDFAFALWNPSGDELFCARDHFGCRPLYYVDQPGFLAVASQTAAFKNLPGFRFEIREQYILDAICSIERTETHSPYRGIGKLKPAHYFKQNAGQLTDQTRYWDLKINESHEKLTLAEASDGLRDRIMEAIRQRIQKHAQIGVELSGGLDSSGIAAVLTMLSGQHVRINAFTHSLSTDGIAQQIYQKSEMEYSTALVEEYSTIRQFIITDKDSEGAYTALTKALSHLNKPVNLHYAMNSDLLFEEAGNVGTSIIFSGLGGDEGISCNGSGYFNELIRQGQHAKLKDTIKHIAPGRGRSFHRKLIKFYINYYAPRVINLYEKDWRKVLYRSFALQRRLARKYRMKRRFYNTHSLPGKADVRAIQYFRIMYPNKPERMEETSLLAQQYGIEYSYAFLDVKLIEFFYSLPSEYKYKDGTGRYLFRMAMKEILPEKIRMRNDKGGNTIPYGMARTLKDEETFRRIISEGRMKNLFHYVDYDKLHDMLDCFKRMTGSKQQAYGLRAFQSAMSVLVLQKWQREGKIDIGIKC